MCLIITKVPQNDRIVKCYKIVRYYNLDEDWYCTPYYDAKIPDDGILLPERASERKNFSIKTRIDGGFIHAYINKRHVDSKHRCFLSYAFRVESYGGHWNGMPTTDLICRGLYIPGLDKTRSYGKILEVKRMLNSDPSTKDLIKEFPRLRRVERFL